MMGDLSAFKRGIIASFITDITVTKKSSLKARQTTLSPPNAYKISLLHKTISLFRRKYSLIFSLGN
jgi:hypothetical protein